MLALCGQNGWVKPTVYQGQYNAICRNMETQLLPLLRRHGIVYVAFRLVLYETREFAKRQTDRLTLKSISRRISYGELLTGQRLERDSIRGG